MKPTLMQGYLVTLISVVMLAGTAALFCGQATADWLEMEIHDVSDFTNNPDGSEPWRVSPSGSLAFAGTGFVGQRSYTSGGEMGHYLGWGYDGGSHIFTTMEIDISALSGAVIDEVLLSFDIGTVNYRWVN